MVPYWGKLFLSVFFPKKQIGFDFLKLSIFLLNCRCPKWSSSLLSSNSKTTPKQFFKGIALGWLKSAIIELFGWYSIVSKINWGNKKIPKPFSQFSFKFYNLQCKGSKWFKRKPRWTKGTWIESRWIWNKILAYPEISFRLKRKINWKLVDMNWHVYLPLKFF